MTEENVKKGNIKLNVFKEFPFDELKKICEAIQNMGYDCTFVDNGNIVFQKR